jgi:hypothetical protein
MDGNDLTARTFELHDITTSYNRRTALARGIAGRKYVLILIAVAQHSRRADVVGSELDQARDFYGEQRCAATDLQHNAGRHGLAGPAE